MADGGTRLPHLDRIQAAFGPEHDLTSLRAHLGGGADRATELLGAEAYTTGQEIAFSGTPSLHTAAHEAAHAVQQRLGEVDAGASGRDRHERTADAVADRVVRGEPAGALLGSASAACAHPGAAGSGAIQCKKQKGKPLDKKHHANVKRWIKQRGHAEITAIVDKLNFATDKPQLVHEQALGDGTVHRFEVSLTWNPAASSSTAPAPDAAKDPTRHVFDVDIGYLHATRDQTTIPKESPYWGLPETGVERGVFLTAEVLYHELLHVLIAIGRQLETLSPGFTGHSATFERYREVMSAATGPGYADLQSKISTGLMGLGLIVRRDLGLTFSNAAIGTWAAEGYEFFVQEKVAFKETGKRFRSSPANAVVAQAYVGNHVRKMLAGTGMDGILYRRLQALPAYADAESAVVADVRELLNGIDTDPALTGEFVPGLMVPSQPGHDAPPLSIGGEPVH